MPKSNKSNKNQNSSQAPQQNQTPDQDLVLVGTDRNDKLSGQGGIDSLSGEAGNDKLEGGAGSDTLAGGAGNDKAFGGDGNDLLIFHATLNVGSHDVYDGDGGVDTLRLVLSSGQASDPSVQAEIAEFQDYLQQGGHGNGNGNAGAFVFHSLGLVVRDIEELEIEVTGGGGNKNPVAGDDEVGTEEDTSLQLNASQLLVNDSDADGDALSVTAVGNAVNGSVSLSNGKISFVPDTDFSGAASFDYTVDDGKGGTDTGTVNVIVNAVNDAPQASDDAVSTDEDTVLNLSTAELTANDLDVDTDPLSITAVANASGGTVTLSGNAIVFTPDSNFNGDGSFDYTVEDGNGGSDTATVQVTVNPVNDAPIAIDDALSTDEDTVLQVAASQLLSNDSDVENDSLSVLSVSNPVNGSVSLADGQISFTPDANFHGNASFEYIIDDGNGGTASALVTVAVNPVNDGPLATDDTLSTDEDTPLTLSASDLLLNDTDIETDALTVTGVANASNGSVSLVGGMLTFIPDTDFNGTASFEYTVDDGNGGIDTAVATVTVNPINDAPVAVADAFAADEDNDLTLSFAQITDNDSDVDSDPLFVSAVNNALNGTVLLNADSVTFTPDANFNGIASFEYTVDDGSGGSSNASIEVTVNPVNDAPLADDDVLSTDEDTVLTVAATQLLSNDTDIDNDSLTVSSVANAIDGTVVLSNGQVTFTPDPDFNGIASFEYEVEDGNGGTDTAVATVTVNPVNDAPRANSDALTLDEDSILDVQVVNLLSNDSDVEDDPLTVSSVSNASNGNVSLSAGVVTFTPNANFNGDASFDYSIDDGNGGTDTATVNLVVNPVNDAPVATDDVFFGSEDVPLTLSSAQLLANDSDVDLDVLTIASVSNAVNGSVSLSGGEVIFTPDVNYNGPALFDYSISDGNGGLDSATASVMFGPVNDAPVAVDDAFEVDENGSLFNSIAGNDSDVDGDTLSFSLSTTVVNGTLHFNADGSFDYTPIPEYWGSDSFSYTVSDGNGLTDTAVVELDIMRAADVPTQIVHEENVAEGETTIGLSIQSLLAGFVSSETLTVTVDNVPSGATLNKGSDNGNGHYTLQPGDLSGLTITLPVGTTGTVPLVVTTIADDGGPISTQTATLNINFGAAALPEIVTGLGGDRDDIINGGAANDYLSGGSGTDVLQGSQGDDVIIGGAGDGDTARYAGFVNHYQLNTSDGLNFIIEDNDAGYVGDDGTDMLSEIEILSTAAFTGSFTGPAVDGVLQMTTGNDIAVAYAGNNTVDYSNGVAGSTGISLNLSQAANGGNISTGQSGSDLLRGIPNVIGSNYNDNIIGDSGANILDGGAGNDILQGSQGDDTLIGGTGDGDLARVSGFVAHYMISTTDGLEYIVTDNNSYAGDDGTDTLTEIEGLSAAAYTGSFAGPAVGGLLMMTPGNDIAVAYGSNVTVDYSNGVSGNSGISINMSQATSGNNISTGQSGSDVLRGILNVKGSANDDTIVGDGNDNTLIGGAGNDVLQGSAGDDNIIGGAGDLDRAQYTGFISHYVLSTSDGLDFTVVDTNSYGGLDGTDSLSQIEGMTVAAYVGDFVGPAVNGVFQMSSGNDIAVAYGSNVTVDYSSGIAGNTGISLDLSQAAGNGNISVSQSGSDVLRGILNITGSAFDDTIIGDTQDNVLKGGDGNDVLQGSQGNDTIIGGAGSLDRAKYAGFINHYTVTTTNGSDFTVVDNNNYGGDDGSDFLTQTEGMTVAAYTGDFTGPAVGGVLQMTAGNDIAIAYGANVTADYSNGVAGNTGISINLSQAAGNGNISVSQSGSDVLRGILNITGSAFADSIVGDANNNVLIGGDGNDVLQGSEGNDTLVGGAGNLDRAQYTGFISHYSLSTSDGLDFTVTDTNSYGGDDGTDSLTQIEGLAVAAYTADFAGPAINGAFQMSSGNDIAVAYGGNVAVDYSNGVAGTSGISINLSHAAGNGNITVSQSGSDLLRGITDIIGSDYDDAITGDNDDNELSGGQGNDNLVGGLGNDTLIGGLGNDILNANGGNDLIVFADDDGQDSVLGFAAGAGTDDVIDLANVSTLDSFADVQSNAVQSGADVEISYTGGVITLVGVSLSNLAADDFQF